MEIKYMPDVREARSGQSIVHLSMHRCLAYRYDKEVMHGREEPRTQIGTRQERHAAIECATGFFSTRPSILFFEFPCARHEIQTMRRSVSGGIPTIGSPSSFAN
jgi:hypothetical protein